MFEIAGVSEEVAREAMFNYTNCQLNKFVKREEMVVNRMKVNERRKNPKGLSTG